MRAIVTVKLPRNPEHDPRNKVSGKCPIQDEYCTDVTGSHHCYIEEGEDVGDIRRKAYEKFGHVTRIETLHTDKLEQRLEAVNNYLSELEGTGNFVDRHKIMNILKGEETLGVGT